MASFSSFLGSSFLLKSNLVAFVGFLLANFLGFFFILKSPCLF
jgi:hypothetical protein